MDLFNISSLFSSDKPKRRRRRHRHSTPSRIRADTFSIDIGEPRAIGITIENACRFTLLSDSANSACIKISYSGDEEDDVLTVRWGQSIKEVSRADHIAALMAKNITSVPIYKSKRVVKHFGKYVGIGVRCYIRGQTLQSVMSSLSPDDIQAVKIQVEAFCWELAKKTSDYFGHIQHGQLRTTTAPAYVTYRAMLDKLSGVLRSEDWTQRGTDAYVGRAVMCHGNLTPEHILVDGTTVTGIVGWGSGDFMPEAYDRVQYYFRSDPTDPYCWNRYMSEMVSTPDTARPSVEFVINTVAYVYKSTWSKSHPRKRRTIDRLYESITTNYTMINCLSIATEIQSDNMSLDSLSEWWETSTRHTNQN